MKKNIGGKNRAEIPKNKPATIELSGYPQYPVGDDIYNKFYEITDLDPEDLSREIDSNQANDSESFILDNSMEKNAGSNLDVPGSELDDELEDIGSEDEENNYYSIGGDNHNNLDENQGQ
ncbi:MAG: hypothetical protein IPH20_25900 [Bacteroidales bacterium]|nr:hypothetical protein [Bacteroidales bacterium]